MKIQLLGECPSPAPIDKRTEAASGPLTAVVGRKIAELCGIEYDSYLELFDRAELFGEWVGKRWPWAEATKRGRAIRARSGPGVILLGRRVACAVLGERDGHGAWYSPFGRFVIVPHPMSPWKPDMREEAMAAARVFWRGLALTAINESVQARLGPPPARLREQVPA